MCFGCAEGKGRRADYASSIQIRQNRSTIVYHFERHTVLLYIVYLMEMNKMCILLILLLLWIKPVTNDAIGSFVGIQQG